MTGKKMRSITRPPSERPMATILYALSVLVVALVLLAGCTKRAYYERMIPAETDVGGIDRVAVAEFDGLRQSGRIVSAKISEEIVDAGYFKLFEREKLDEILSERDFSRSDEVDPNTANELKLMGVDALIFGVVDVFSVDDQTGIQKVEREVNTGRTKTVEKEGEDGDVIKVEEEIKETILVDRGYIIRNGTVGVTFRMANINTGEIVAVKTETGHFSKKEWEDRADKLPTKDMILDDLATRVVIRFMRQIQPRYVRREVKFETNQNSNTDVGIKYAQTGLWDKTEGAFKKAAEASPEESSTHYNFAVTSGVMGKYKNAIIAIERAIELKPKGRYIDLLAQLRMEAEEAEILEQQWK